MRSISATLMLFFLALGSANAWQHPNAIEYGSKRAGWAWNNAIYPVVEYGTLYGEGARPLTADGNSVLIGLVAGYPCQLASMAPDGRVAYRPADNCIAAGPTIACFSSPRVQFWRVGKLGDPNSIVRAPDGYLWFADAVNSRLGRISHDGRITEFSKAIPSRSSIGGICAGPGGNLWYTLYHGNVLGRITTSGVVTLYRGLVHPSRGPDQNPAAVLVRDRSGRLFYNETQAGRIARATIAP